MITVLFILKLYVFFLNYLNIVNHFHFLTTKRDYCSFEIFSQTLLVSHFPFFFFFFKLIYSLLVLFFALCHVIYYLRFFNILSLRLRDSFLPLRKLFNTVTDAESVKLSDKSSHDKV